jgi:hypothetical protein
MKYWRGRRFDDTNDSRRNTTAALKNIPQNQFQNCFERLTRHWHRCIASQWDYFEGHHSDIEQWGMWKIYRDEFANFIVRSRIYVQGVQRFTYHYCYNKVTDYSIYKPDSSFRANFRHTWNVWRIPNKIDAVSRISTFFSPLSRTFVLIFVALLRNWKLENRIRILWNVRRVMTI